MSGFFLKDSHFRVVVDSGLSLMVSFICSVITGIYTLCKNRVLRCCRILRGIRNTIILNEVLLL